MSLNPGEELARLRDLLCNKSLQLGEFTLVSGEKSSVYVDSKLTTYSAAALPLVGRAFLRKFQQRGWTPDATGGLTLGADPIALAIARESADAGRAIDAFTVRKAAKDHGTARRIEGLAAPSGLKVVILDDVCTKGGSTAQAVEKALEAGMIVLGAVCLVDREQGAAEMLEQRFGVALERIFTLAELLARKKELSPSGG
jgi:orotate phosphoribosyltransferase